MERGGFLASNYSNLYRIKQEIRERVWRRMEEEGIAIFPRPVYGRIPNFRGHVAAAARLMRHDLFRRAKVIFCCPDSPQRPVREGALRSGKLLIMASPRLRSGFLILDPKKIPPSLYRRASTIRGAFSLGDKVEFPAEKIDLKVTGSVAVSVDGGRVGKGGGFSDLEYAILRELGVVDDDTPVVTTVHEVQIVNFVPMTAHDVPIDYIFTPSRTIKTRGAYTKPKGIIWEELDHRKLEEIPILRRLAERRR